MRFIGIKSNSNNCVHSFSAQSEGLGCYWLVRRLETVLRGEDGTVVDRREFSVDLNTGAAVDWYLRHFTTSFLTETFAPVRLIKSLNEASNSKTSTEPAVLTDWIVASHVGKCVCSIGVGSAGPSTLVPAGWYAAPAAATSTLLTGLELNTLHTWDPTRLQCMVTVWSDGVAAGWAG